MPVKIRLQRHGKKGKPFFHIVVADSRAPRDGRFIERIGNYNPITDPATIEINNDRALDWLMKGAQPSDTTRAILSYKGILFKAHLQKGVVKGVMTQEQADAKFETWTQEQHSKVENKKRRLADSKKQVLSARLEQESKVNAARMDNLRRLELEAKLAAEAPVATEEAAPAAEEGETPAEA